VRAQKLATALLILLLVPAAGCWTTTHPDGRHNPDPAEPTNRVVFAFNDGLDTILIEPIARAWRFVTPGFVRSSLDKAFYNLRAPGRIFSELGQAEGGKAGHETARFLVNTTVGVLGLWDPAGRMGLRTWEEDFGQMFGVWGVPTGAYWVVPIVGPSNPRDFTGYVFDSVFNLTPSYVAPVAWINTRAIALPTTDLVDGAALDDYLFVRDAYLQRRQALVENRDTDAAAPETEDDLYEVDPEILAEEGEE